MLKSYRLSLVVSEIRQCQFQAGPRFYEAYSR